MCKLTKKFAYPGGVVGFSEFKGGRICQGGREKFRGLRPPLELCFGTSEI